MRKILASCVIIVVCILFPIEFDSWNDDIKGEYVLKPRFKGDNVYRLSRIAVNIWLLEFKVLVNDDVKRYMIQYVTDKVNKPVKFIKNSTLIVHRALISESYDEAKWRFYDGRDREGYITRENTERTRN